MDLSLRTESYGVDDQSWLGSAHGADSTESVTLDTSAFTAGTHYDELGGRFFSGIALARVAGGKFGPAAAAADVEGFLWASVSVPKSNTVDPSGAMLVRGTVRVSRLPVAVTGAAAGDTVGLFRYI